MHGRNSSGVDLSASFVAARGPTIFMTRRIRDFIPTIEGKTRACIDQDQLTPVRPTAAPAFARPARSRARHGPRISPSVAAMLPQSLQSAPAMAKFRVALQQQGVQDAVESTGRTRAAAYPFQREQRLPARRWDVRQRGATDRRQELRPDQLRPRLYRGRR